MGRKSLSLGVIDLLLHLGAGDAKRRRAMLTPSLKHTALNRTRPSASINLMTSLLAAASLMTNFSFAGQTNRFS